MRFVCAVAGERKFDLNEDGVAQYGMYADLLAYMGEQPGGERASRLLFNSAEAYLRTWRRAERAAAARGSGWARPPRALKRPRWRDQAARLMIRV